MIKNTESEINTLAKWVKLWRNCQFEQLQDLLALGNQFNYLTEIRNKIHPVLLKAVAYKNIPYDFVLSYKDWVKEKEKNQPAELEVIDA